MAIPPPVQSTNTANSITIAKTTPTFSRAKQQLGLAQEADSEALQQKCSAVLQTINDQVLKSLVTDPATKEQLARYNKFMDLLEGPLPHLDTPVDFTDKKTIDAAVDHYFTTIINNVSDAADAHLSIDEKVKKQDLSQKQIADIKDYLKMRLLLNIQGKIDLANLLAEQEADAWQGYIAALQEHENMLRQFAHLERPGGAILQSVTEGAKLDPKQWDQLISENAHKVSKYVAVTVDKDGEPFVAISSFNEASVNTTLNVLKHSSTIDWYNVPSLLQNRILMACLRQGKHCVLHNGNKSHEPLLSKTMPSPPHGPDTWVNWLIKIKESRAQDLKQRQKWMQPQNKAMRVLIQKVIQSDDKKLQEFWSGVVKHKLTAHIDNKRDESFWANIVAGDDISGGTTKDDNDIPTLGDIAKHFTPKQQAALEKVYIERINNLIDRINNHKPKTQDPQDPQYLRYSTQLKNAQEELQYLYAAQIASLGQKIDKQLHILRSPADNMAKLATLYGKRADYLFQLLVEDKGQSEETKKKNIEACMRFFIMQNPNNTEDDLATKIASLNLETQEQVINQFYEEKVKYAWERQDLQLLENTSQAYTNYLVKRNPKISEEAISKEAIINKINEWLLPANNNQPLPPGVQSKIKDKVSEQFDKTQEELRQTIRELPEVRPQ